MGKWFGQAQEIKRLRAENASLHAEVARLESLLRGGLAAESEIGVPKRGWSESGLSFKERSLLQQGKKISAIKEYRIRTGAGLAEAKQTIEAAQWRLAPFQR